MTLSDIKKEVEQVFPAEIEKFRSSFPYRLPKGYPTWDLLTAAALTICKNSGQEANDRSVILSSEMWLRWLETQSPLYCISKELLREFENTDTRDLPRIIPHGWIPPLPYLLLIPPCSTVRTPGGADVPYLMLGCSHPSLLNCMTSEHKVQISVAFADWNEELWITGTGLYPGQLVNDGKSSGKPTTQDELGWLGKITSLALQSLLALTYEPELGHCDLIAMDQTSM